MRARVLACGDVLKIVDLLRRQGYEVIAPFHGRGRDTFFDTVTDQNRDQIQIHLPNPYYPPKRYVFPHIERLLKVERNNGNLHIEPTYEQPKRAIFGIRSCDIAGIFHLDRFYLGREFRDIYYDGPPQEPAADQCRLQRSERGHRRGMLLHMRRHWPSRPRPLRPATDGSGR